VQPYERRLGARRREVDGLGDELLARPTLAGQKDARFARPDLRDEVEDGAHLRVVGHDVTEGVAFAQPVT
jgi:hypothetical protein